jgi:hypothetical protein
VGEVQHRVVARTVPRVDLDGPVDDAAGVGLDIARTVDGLPGRDLPPCAARKDCLLELRRGAAEPALVVREDSEALCKRHRLHVFAIDSNCTDPRNLL